MKTEQLHTVIDPHTHKALADRVRQVNDTVTIACPYPIAGNNGKKLLATITRALPQFEHRQPQLTFAAPNTNNVRDSADKRTPIPNISNVIAVGSGKGGVGKSTIASGIAHGLHAAGARVGILDADIYGANQHLLMGLPRNNKITVNKDKQFIPFESQGIVFVSFAGVTEADMPVVWRGPMISSALQQLALKTQWPQLDYLVVDLPPGTGDIQLTLFQQMIVSGFVLVSTPQAMSVEEARKTLSMVAKFDLDVLGMVENMNRFICSQCGSEHALFGNHAEQLARSENLDMLASMPVDLQLTDGDGRLDIQRKDNSVRFIAMAEAIAVTLANLHLQRRGAVIASG